MFEKIRRPGRSKKDNSFKKATSYVVFGAICLVFVFLGPVMGDFFGEGAVAYVASKPIHAREFRMIQEQVQRRYQAELDKADSKLYSKLQDQIRQESRRIIVDQAIVEKAAELSGFVIGEEELRDEIRKIPIFQENGQFRYSKYLGYLKERRLRASRFESWIQKDSLRLRFREIFGRATGSSKLEAKKQKQTQNQKLNFQFVSFSLEEASEIEDLLKKNPKNVESFLKTKKKSWKKTGEFDIFSPFGIEITRNKNVMDEVIKALPKKGLVKKLIPDGEKVYLVSILSFEKKAPTETEKKLQELLKLRSVLPDRLFASFLNHYQQKIKVKFPPNSQDQI